ncbi:MAG: type IV toxin-antitoxin system AbiEi family antitoxin domain-containing protein [Pseudolysinimonas sp.]
MSDQAFERAGLIFADEVRRAGEDPRRLRDGVRQGLFVRVRRGAYCTRVRWDSLSNRERHVLAVRAVVRDTAPPFLVAGRSAAAVYGMPFCAFWPERVTLLVPWRGGGSSEPGIARTTNSAASARADSFDGIPITTRDRTVLDVAREAGHANAVALLDWAQSRRRKTPLKRESVEAELRRSDFTRGRRAASAAFAFSTHLSDSPGESLARVAIHRLGFEVPQLQVEFTDSQGAMYPDFYWPSIRVAAEFDGKVKYTRDEFTGGDPAEVVWKEKQREDRLRRQVARVDRIVSADVADPRRLARILTDAGVPRGSVRR